ncbi:hypothetical protein F4212_00350 [Candidatus Poribacteria bacterium]|nr:hypothetical protein [Candidatus Poribacteria bacterium]
MRTTKWIGLVYSLFIGLIGITGCSDNSYTGPMINHYTGSMLQPGDVDQYLFTSLDGRICLSNDFDTVCAANRSGNQPIIQILPSKLVYTFYFGEKPILQAEKDMDTTDIIVKIGEEDPPRTENPLNGGNTPNGDGNTPNTGNPPGTGGGDPPNGNGNPPNGNGNPPNGDGNPPNTGNPPTGGGDPPGTGDPPTGGGDPPNTGDPTDTPDDNPEAVDGGIFTKPVKAQDANSANGWYIWLYYPADRFETGILSLEASGLEIIINGNEITDDDIVSFEQGSSEHGTYFKFFYPTAKSSFTDLTIQVTGLVSPTGTVNFIISAPQ